MTFYPIERAIASFVYMDYDLVLKGGIFPDTFNAAFQVGQVIPGRNKNGKDRFFISGNGNEMK
ncbi:MAG: hypothetical protein WDN75_18910 [Bacteroidota bacterium]